MTLVMVAPISSQAKLSHHMRKLTSGAAQRSSRLSRCKVCLKEGICQNWRQHQQAEPQGDLRLRLRVSKGLILIWRAPLLFLPIALLQHV